MVLDKSKEVLDKSKKKITTGVKKLLDINEGKQIAKPLDEERKAAAEEQRKLISKDISKSVTPQADPADKVELPIPKKKQRRRRTLKELLPLAGMDVEPILIYKRVFLAAVLTTLAVTFTTMYLGLFHSFTFETQDNLFGYVQFVIALWTVVFAGILGIYGAIFAFYLDLRIHKRRREIEAVFPDYLQLAAANLGAGMTIDRALWSAVRPRFGVLSQEIEDVAKKTMTGYDLERALQEFTDKYDSTVLKRSINLIIEGIHSGGRMADILNKIAIDIQENNIMQKEMSANVTTYVIFISFATVLAAPFLFGLSTQLLSVIKGLAANMGDTSTAGVGLQLNPDVIKTSDFKIFSITVLTISSVMSACIVAVIRKGSVVDGIRLIPIFWIVTVILYYIATWGLTFLFSGVA